MITQDPNETNLHIVQMGKLNIKDLEAYAAGLKKQYDHIVGMSYLYKIILVDHSWSFYLYLILAFKPSGWTHNSSTQNGLSIERKSKNITIYGKHYFMPYKNKNSLKTFVF